MTIACSHSVFYLKIAAICVFICCIIQFDVIFFNKSAFFFQESEETMAELKNVYEREKIMLMEENKKCQFELERMAELNNRLQLEKRQYEDDYHELRTKKEAVAQWEAQISEIINW